MALSYFVGTATQGSADAFVEAEIATALSGQTSRAARVREIIFQLPAGAAAANTQYQVALSRRTQAAFPNITDRNVIAMLDKILRITTSGAAEREQIARLTFTEDDNLLVVEDPVYFQFDTASTTLSNTAYVRIGYELVNISANDRLQIALQSLNEAT